MLGVLMIAININGLEPVAKGRPRLGRGGRTYTPEKTRKFEEAVSLSAIARMRRQGAKLTAGPVAVEIKFAFEPPASWPQWKKGQALGGHVRHTGRFDVDNGAKGVLDALNGIAWEDDAQVCELTAKKCYAEKQGVYIRIRPIAGHGSSTVKKGDLEK